MNFCTLCAALIVTVAIAEGNTCTRRLLWAPTRPKRVFMTFLNDINCPSWQTTHSFTKDPTGKDHLTLPQHVPFAFGCGACYTPSDLQANLTLHVQSHECSARPIGGAASLEHSENSLECLVSYALTSPVTTSGKVTCTLNRGRTPAVETLHFNVKSVPIKYVDSFDWEVHEKDVQLSCPQPQVSKSELGSIVYVWHKLVDDDDRIVTPSLKAHIDLLLKSPETKVACSVYNMLSPRVVWRTVFTIRTTQVSNALARNEMIEGEPGASLAPTVIGIIGIAAFLVCAVVSLVVIKLTAAARQRAKAADPCHYPLRQ